MRTEIQAAVQHIAALVRADAHSPAQRGSFIADLSARLASRYASCWYVEDGERGSAWRALSWQTQSGAAGVDRDIVAALSSSFGRQNIEAMLPITFTMWIDPGCVAIRTEANTSTASWTPTIGTVKVVFGTQPSAAIPVHVKPTLAPLRIALNGHERMQSWTSNASSSSYGRSSSPGAYSTSSFSEYGESCPSLTAASSVRSECSDVEESESQSSACSEASMDDLIDRAAYKDFSFVDADDELELSSALRRRTLQTVTSVDETICEEDDDSDNEGDETVHAIEGHRQQPITCYDGGNVGVLGGGVRLGSAAPRAQKPAALCAPLDLSALWTGNVAMQEANLWAQPSAYLLSPTDSQFSTGSFVAPIKRSRTRGRRSRGRGAGRAARRQAAAALRAIESMQGESDECEIEGGHGLEGISPSVHGGALGLRISCAEGKAASDADESARIMSVVRQRAAEVAKDVERRQQQQQMQRSHSANVLPVTHTRFAGQTAMTQPPQLHRLQHKRSQTHLAQLPCAQQQRFQNAPSRPALPQQYIRAGAPALHAMASKSLPQHRSTNSLSDMASMLHVDNTRAPTPHYPHFARHAQKSSLSMLPPLAHALPAVHMY